MHPLDLSAVTLCGVTLRNPVLAASGTFGYGLEFETLVDLEALGGFVVKGLSREPIEGNPAPRLYETEAGMLNSVGLQNIGVRAFVRDKLPRLAGDELNVSCPNTRGGGMFFSSDPALLEGVVRAVKQVASRPVMVKLSPNVARIEPLAQAAERAGAGGLSGPAIKPIALRMVCQAARAVKIPVVGLGGIAAGIDAAEFLIAGATAVQVGTATFWDPASPARIARELGRFLAEEGTTAAALVGTLEL